MQCFNERVIHNRSKRQEKVRA